MALLIYGRNLHDVFLSGLESLTCCMCSTEGTELEPNTSKNLNSSLIMPLVTALFIELSCSSCLLSGMQQQRCVLKEIYGIRYKTVSIASFDIMEIEKRT